MVLICFTLWLFNIAMEAMAHLQMIFPAINLHLSWIFQFAILKNQMVIGAILFDPLELS